MITSTLNGLVLAGGKSLRMGKDKGQISYHGVPQSIFLYRLLDPICEQVFLSIRSDQLDQYDNSYRIIVDQDQYRGPFNGLLSAHQQDPEAAWLAVACDVPLIDRESLELLINERDQTRAATALATHKTGLPEPLVAIWEPHGLQPAKDYLKTSESSCPRKFLLNSEVKLVQPREDKVLLNANSQEDYLEVMKILSTV